MSLFGDLNEIKLLGNITQDPELRFTQNGTAVCSLSIATNRRYRQNDEWKDSTEFHNIVIWSNLAQQVAQRSKKGTRVLITGRMQTRSWEGKDGQKRYTTEVVADDVFLIDRYEKGKSSELPPAQATSGSAGNASGGNSGGGGFNNAPSQQAPAGNSAPGAPSPSAAGSAPQQNKSQKLDEEIDPDDLPF